MNEQKINDLELLGKMWGFLKYYHPEVAIGNYNWDCELFRMLPEYLRANKNAQRDSVLLRWIQKYEPFPSSDTNTETPDDAFLKPDFSWIDKSDMNQNLKEKLKDIYRNRYQGDHFYIHDAQKSSKIIMFPNENSYSNMPYPNAGFRLLALYRYWNMINYFYPYKYLTDKKWDEVLNEYIPQFVLADSELNYELSVLKLIGEIDDSHAALLEGRSRIDSLRGNWVAPFHVKFIENQIVVTKYYNPDLQETTGLKIGDIITKINGKPVKAIVDSVREYYPSSNEPARMRAANDMLLRSRSKTIQINYISSNQSKQKELTLYDMQSMRQYVQNQNKYKKDSILSYKLLNDTIGYITLQSLKQEDIAKIEEIFKNTKGIIIDIRNYPSDNIYPLPSYFISKDTLVTKYTKGNPDNPGEFTFVSPEKMLKLKDTYHGKLVVIVNEETQSAAEFAAMAFQAGENTTVIGSQTAGADGAVTEIVLPGGIKTRITGIGVYYPDGRQTQRIGIVLDIVVKPTIKGIREGRDEVLEKAIEIIKKGK